MLSTNTIKYISEIDKNVAQSDQLLRYVPEKVEYLVMVLQRTPQTSFKRTFTNFNIF